MGDPRGETCAIAPKIVIAPGKSSIPAKGEPHGGTERERHAAQIAARGRMAWQQRHGYGKRSLVETAISRINGGRLTSRTFGAQQNVAAIHVKIANRNMILARPQSERVRSKPSKDSGAPIGLCAPRPCETAELGIAA